MNTLTRDIFERWMHAINGRLDRHEEILHSMNKGVGIKHMTERLLDNQNVCLLLKISKRTLQRYRSGGILPYKVLGHKIYYTEKDVLNFISSNIRYPEEKNIEFYKARIDNIINK